MDKPKDGKSQVVVRLTISCGCGFLAQTMSEAGDHSERLGHVMTVHGQVGEAGKLQLVEVTRAKR